MLSELTARFSGTAENQKKAIFSSLFIAANKLQTLFDNHIPQISLKQFMLLSIVRQSKESLTFTQLGNILGCSRQNIKKLVDVFFENDFAEYQKELKYLFEVYTDQEVETLFNLMSKLYAGIENLEKKAVNKKTADNDYQTLEK